MILHDAGAVAVVRPYEMFRSLTAEARGRHYRRNLFDVLQQTLDDVRIGETVYRAVLRYLRLFTRERGSERGTGDDPMQPPDRRDRQEL